MAKDFFDDDLTRASTGKEGAVEEKDGVPIRAITEASLNRMVRQKQEISNQVVGALTEIEQLRRRQQDLEKTKSSLEDLTRRQDEYERGKREIMGKIHRGTLLMEKEEVEAVRRAELLSAMRARLKETLAEMSAINEATWSDQSYEAELQKALALVEDAKAVYKKTLAKIDAQNWDTGGLDKAHPSKLDKVVAEDLGGRPGAGYWFKAGLAASVPFAVIVILALVVHALLRAFGGADAGIP
jgi:hypothetical protein